MNIDTSIFKAYDIRGIYPEQINADLVYKIIQGYVQLITRKDAETNAEGRGNFLVVVGHDMRLSGEEFSESAISALTDAGINVIDIGLVSTDQLYFAAATLPVAGGIQITASHNPKEFGGMKLVRAKGAPISGDSGIYEIRDMVISNFQFPISKNKGKVEKKDIKQEYFDHVFKTFDVSKIKPLKIVANTNFGMATQVIDELKKRLPIEFLEVVNPELDGNFPKGPSDPLLPSNRGETIAAIEKLHPDFGVAWDGDADRCFFFDENGKFITPAYINALLAGYYLQKYPGGKVLHDTRVVRVIDYAIAQNHGVAIMNKAGHSFIKERMAKEDAVFGNETSGHYYFKDNFYLDNGLFPLLAVLDILSTETQKNSLQMPTEAKPMTFSELLKPLREKFYISEEINFEFTNTNILEDIKNKYSDAEIDNTDGFSFSYPSWRFNVRSSNTQNLLRLNLEADSEELLKQKTDELVGFINEVK
ncbi:MAG: phosphomannomutase/phosphoglucomutase [Candidatus Doudnabacteria bacterium]|nr:phosphomannomutase/phosphoglucomutase [Candidatus Doudnabacteria bacterium]